MLRILIGLAIGGALGAFVGWKGRCTTGACPLTSNPYIGGIYGAVMGALIAGVLAGPGNSSGATSKEMRKPAAAAETAAMSTTKGDTAMGLVHIDSTTAFDTLVRDTKGPVLVDFWATWCAPCRIQGKILEEMAGSLNGHAVIAKVDVDKVGELANRFGIQSIPTLMLFENGKMTEKWIGVQPKAKLMQVLGLVTN